MTPPGAVFDAVTFVQSLANPDGPAAACWQRVLAGELQLFTDDPTLAEVADVVSRPKVAKRLAFDAEIAKSFLDEIRKRSTQLASVPSRFSYARDPKDEPLVNLALAAGAKYLVTWDNDLLDLMQPDNADGIALRLQLAELVILTPPDLMRILRTHSPG
jgi:putative PIN family toxin of toxin-antitoxin system